MSSTLIARFVIHRQLHGKGTIQDVFWCSSRTSLSLAPLFHRRFFQSDVPIKCGEGQSIVKVWGRGGHAKDVRGLVMALNAAAGEGEDPNNVLRDNVGGSGPQSQSKRHSHDGRNPGGRIVNKDCDRAYSGAYRAAPQHTVGPAEPGSYKRNCSWARPQGFVPASVAPTGDEHDPAVGSWHASRDKKMNGVISGPQDSWDGRSNAGYPRAGGATGHRSGGFGTSREHHPDVRALWQPAAEPAGGGGRSGSRWGAFASHRATEVFEGRPGPNQEVHYCSPCDTAVVFVPTACGASLT